MEKLETHRIQSAPSHIYYIPDFISSEEENHILHKIPSNRWITLAHRRLQAHPSPLSASNTLLAANLPSWLTDPIVARVHALGIFNDAPHGGINHCLINEYLPGQGIMPHEDGPAYHPVVATVSLGGTVVLDVTAKDRPAHSVEDDGGAAERGPVTTHWRIVQEPRSLLITRGPAYTDTLHGIAPVTEDADLNERSVANWRLLGDRAAIEASGGTHKRGMRISLTFRSVKRVSSIGSKIFGRAKT